MAFHVRPSNREEDINLTDFHYSRPSNKLSVLDFYVPAVSILYI